MTLKKIGFFVIIIASVFVMNSFVHSIYNLWQKNDLLVKAKQNLAKEKNEHDDLKKQLAQVQKPEFVEEEARNKLFMAKPGEDVLVIPDKVLSANAESHTKPVDTRSNWQKWWDLFF